MQGKHERAITVVLVEPHPLASAWLRRVLRESADIAIAGGGHQPGLDLAGRLLVFVIDAVTVGRPVSELLRSMRQRYPSASAIILNKQCSGDELMEMLFSGASGFVAYDRVADELERAVRSVAAGNAWIEACILKRFKQRGGALRLARGTYLKALTSREMTILGLLDRGLSNKEISATLSISESTVKFHVTNIFNKAGVHNRVMAVNWATLNKILNPIAPE